MGFITETMKESIIQFMEQFDDKLTVRELYNIYKSEAVTNTIISFNEFDEIYEMIMNELKYEMNDLN